MFHAIDIDVKLTDGTIFMHILYINNEQGCFIRYKENEAIAECFIPDKTRTASLLYGFKNEPFRKFIDVNILKIDLV